MLESNYPIAVRGYASSFSEAEMPKEFASKFENMFINSAGGAEMRQGMTAFSVGSVGEYYTVTGLHELIEQDGSVILFASAAGKIWVHNETTDLWGDPVYSFASATARVQSVNMNDRIIFYNGTNPSAFTTDGVTFSLLKPLMEQGSCATGTSATAIRDSTIPNWVSNTTVATDDLVYNVDLNTYGIVTAVVSAEVRHTPMGSAATGLGHSSNNPQVAHRYQVHDMVALDIVPSTDPNVKVNVGETGAGTTASIIRVSGLNFAQTEIRVGDIVYNSTRTAVTIVTAVNVSSLGVVGITGQVELDSLIFMKPALPIAKKAHVHFGRLYIVDARNAKKIYYSGPDDSQDWSANSGLIDTSTAQPSGDLVQNMDTFQRFFVIGTTRHIYFYEGVDPTDAATFLPLGSLPQGVVSPLGLAAIGNEIIFFSNEGVQSASLVRFSTQFGRNPISNQINKTLREALKNASEEQTQMIHYPRRSQVFCRIGENIYIYNYIPSVSRQQPGTNIENPTQIIGSWSVYRGLLAEQSVFFVRNNGDMLTGGKNGAVSLFDAGDYSDLGDPIRTVYQTGWLTTTDPKISVKQKHGVYLKVLAQVGAAKSITIDAEAPFDRTSTDTATYVAGAAITPIGVFIVGTDSIGGSTVSNNKLSMRWKGERVRLTFSTTDTAGPYILNSFTIFSNLWGKL